jgi:hypothetical protein
MSAAPPQNRRQSMRKSFGTSVSSSAAAAATANLSAMHLSTMYHTVLKLSSENKITAKNSWQLPLIDHMQSLIRGDMKGGAAGSGTGPSVANKTSGGSTNIAQKDSSSSSSAAAAAKGGATAPTASATSTSVSSKVFTAGTNGGKSAAATTTAPQPSFATRDSNDNVDVALLNFQRASCTLDASVKIWSCRVDDVYTSSFRVLENLSRTGDQQIKEGEEDLLLNGALDAESSAVAGGGSRGSNADDYEDDDGEGSGKARSNKQSAAARAAARVSATIETNLSNITAKRIDSSVEVDPMYARLSGGGGSSDTGEGAAGMLLCRLSVHIGCELAFDSSEVGDVDAMEGSGFLLSSHRMFPSESASLIEALPINTLNEDDEEIDTKTGATATTTTITSESDATPFLKTLKNAELARSIEVFHSSMRTHATMINDSVTLALLPPPPVVPSSVDFKPQSRLSIGGGNSSSSSSSSLFIGAVKNSIQINSSSSSSSSSIAVAAAAAAAASEGSGNGGAWAAVARIAEGIESANNTAVTSSSHSSASSSSLTSAIVETATLAAIDDALDAAKLQETEAALQSAVVTSNNNAANDDNDQDDHGGDAAFGDVGSGDHNSWPVGGGNDDYDDDNDDENNPHDQIQGATGELSVGAGIDSTGVVNGTSSLGIAAGPAASGAAAEYTFVDLAALTTAAGGTGSASSSSHWRFKANARKAAADVKQRAQIAAEKAKGGVEGASTIATAVSVSAKGKGAKGKKAAGGNPTAAEAKRALAAKGGLDFLSESGPSPDAFSKGKVPLASAKASAASKVGNIVGMAPTQRDAEQLQPAAVEKLTSRGPRANTLPLVPGGATLGATLSGGACPTTLKPLGPKALLSNMHLFLRPTVVLPISTGIDEKDAISKQMERGIGAAGEILYPSARAAAARAIATTTGALNNRGGTAAIAAAQGDDDEDAGGGYWPSGGGGDDYDDPEYGGGGGSTEAFSAPAFVGNASSPMKSILAAAAAESVTSVDPNGAQPTSASGSVLPSGGPVELIAAGRHVEKIRVKYATVANRVDVHALKDDMRSLLLNSALRKTTHKAFESELKAKALEHERSFTDVSTASSSKAKTGSSSSSSTTVSPQGMRFAEHVIKPMVPSMSKEVSVSFYLITLLHLCNDHNLVLSREDLRDFEVLSLEERGPVKGL